jgi:hypothetical protein
MLGACSLSGPPAPSTRMRCIAVEQADRAYARRPHHCRRRSSGTISRCARRSPAVRSPRPIAPPLQLRNAHTRLDSCRCLAEHSGLCHVCADAVEPTAFIVRSSRPTRRWHITRDCHRWDPWADHATCNNQYVFSSARVHLLLRASLGESGSQPDASTSRGLTEQSSTSTEASSMRPLFNCSTYSKFSLTPVGYR